MELIFVIITRKLMLFKNNLKVFKFWNLTGLKNLIKFWELKKMPLVLKSGQRHSRAIDPKFFVKIFYLSLS